MDIRKFFAPLHQSKKVEEKKRKKCIIEDSDSDDDPLPKSRKKSKTAVVDSDDDIFTVNNNKKQKTLKLKQKVDSKPTLKIASATDFFGSSIVQRSDKISNLTKKKKLEKKDKDFERTLNDLETDETIQQRKKIKLKSPKNSHIVVVDLVKGISGKEKKDKDFEKTLNDLETDETIQPSKKIKLKSPENSHIVVVDLVKNINGKEKISAKKEEYKIAENEKSLVNKKVDKFNKNSSINIANSKNVNCSEKVTENSDKKKHRNKSKYNNINSNIEINEKVNTPEKIDDSIIPANSRNVNYSEKVTKNDPDKKKHRNKSKNNSNIEIVRNEISEKVNTTRKIDDSIIPANSRNVNCSEKVTENAPDKKKRKSKNNSINSNIEINEKVNTPEKIYDSIIPANSRNVNYSDKVTKNDPNKKKHRNKSKNNSNIEIVKNEISEKVNTPKKIYDSIIPADSRNVNCSEKVTKKKHRNKSKNNSISSNIEIVKNEISENTPEKIDDSIIPATPEEIKVNSRALAYRKYMQRPGPSKPGSKIIPEGTSNCLVGLTFVLTGVLESFNREEIVEAIKERGGRVTSCVSKNTSYLLIGDGPGESKTKKAEKLSIKFLSEDELLAMIDSHSSVKNGNSDKIKNIKQTKRKISEVIPDTNKKEENIPDKDKRNANQNIPLSSSRSPLILSSQSSTTSSLSETSIPSIESESLSKSSIGQSLWVDKYKPTSLKNIIGQHGDASNAKKLCNWLRSWSRNQSEKVKLVKPSPWSKENTGAYFKAALLSGPPGVGKTTTVNVVCKELNFDAVEFNASDTRSKRSMQQEITELLSSKSLAGFQKDKKMSNQRVLVMDEVDGMSGNQDRGGMQELISLIKSSKIPVICMCNDRNSQKIRSLANYCFDLKYYKPRVEQIRGAMMSVCFKEGLKIKPEILDEIIIGSNQDVRQVLNHLSVWSADNKELNADQTKKDVKMAKKEFKIGLWDVCSQVFNNSSHKKMSIHDKIGLFFNDYSLGPLFVQENYPKVSPICSRGNPKMLMDQIAKAACSISDGDLVEKSIRSDSAWSLLPTQAIFSSVLPGEHLSGYMSAQVEFPRWLGNYSKQKKFDRLAQELHTHMILRISGSKRDVILDYSNHLRNAVITPLASKGQEGIQDAVNSMVSYDLIREDLESLLELSSWSHTKNHMASVESKVKSAFTRNLNKNSHMNPYGVGNISRKAKKSDSHNEDGMNEEFEESDYEENTDINGDSSISVSKKTTKASTSRSKGKGKK